MTRAYPVWLRGALIGRLTLEAGLEARALPPGPAWVSVPVFAAADVLGGFERTVDLLVRERAGVTVLEAMDDAVRRAAAFKPGAC